MSIVDHLIRENTEVLNQALQLVDQTSDLVYTHNNSPYFKSGVGRHVRHILDFYACFLNGLKQSARIDYDRRGRSADIETQRSTAATHITTMQAALQEIKAGEIELQVKNDDGGGRPDVFSPSCLSRELQFLLSHTIHHFAIIAMILRLQDQPLPADGFGVAPSTLLYQHRKAKFQS